MTYLLLENKHAWVGFWAVTYHY